VERVIDCQLRGLGEIEMLDEKVYQNSLLSEIAFFLGYCRSLYEPYYGKRIPYDRESIRAIAEESDSEALEFFHAHYINEKGAIVEGHIVKEHFTWRRYPSKLQKQFHEAWARCFGIKKVRTSSGFVFKNMRPRVGGDENLADQINF